MSEIKAKTIKTVKNPATIERPKTFANNNADADADTNNNINVNNDVLASIRVVNSFSILKPDDEIGIL